MDTDLSKYLDFAIETAYLAGRATLGFYRTGLRPDMKADNTPVTAADRTAEQIIRTRIKERYPEHALLGEEYGMDGRDNASHRWIIDPIDGTKQFVRGLPLFGVLIGLEIEGKTEVGVAYFPAVDEMISAANGQGCWWNGRRAYVSEVRNLKEGVFMFEAAHFPFLRQAWDEITKATYHQMGWGDAYSYILVATGRAEMAIDSGMQVWDCGPLAPILNEAGGYFGDWEGHPLSYGREVMATTPHLLSQAIELAAKIRASSAD